MNDLVFTLIGLVLVLLSGFFVAAEYAMVSARPSKLEAAAKKGSAWDRLAVAAVQQQTSYVAGIQVWITLLGIGMGAVLEPWLSSKLDPLFPKSVPEFVVSIISVLIVAFPLVVLGELVPKYLALQFPEKVLRLTIAPLRLLTLIIKPISFMLQKVGQFVLKLLRIPADEGGPAISREELYYMIRSGEEGGGLHEDHADYITKTLRLDELDAEDAMLHRLDIKWLDVDTHPDHLIAKIAEIPHSRIPVCRGDIDDVVGIAYLHDIVCNMGKPDFNLADVARQPVYVPESLTLNRLIEIMRDTKSQIAIVQDEYGGTQGLVTLEDVIEEVFGDMEDSIESERAPIERTSPGRISLRPDVRYDELLEFLEIEPDEQDEFTTQTLAGIVVEKLGRTAGLGDAIELPIGKFRVEQAAQRRITRIGFYPRRRPKAEETAS
ncbi:MAG: HlyC/CorC family transporter [Fimbriimonadaceae bacterium]|nr:MAG: HlyC/CorC family transporter [Fimbriimonadaceae bacterium]